MLDPGLSPRRPITWRLMMALAIVAILCRALVPSGYMPDTEALRDGRLAVTYCSASGNKTVAWLDLGLSDHSSDSSPAIDTDCPYGLLAGQSFIPGHHGLTTGIPTAALARALPTPETFFHSPSPGPPLGSRAPPAILA